MIWQLKKEIDFFFILMKFRTEEKCHMQLWNKVFEFFNSYLFETCSRLLQLYQNN